MTPHTRIISHVPGWAEEYSSHVHEFAERKVRKKHADQKEVNVKDRANFGWYGWLKRHQANCQPFN